MVFMRVAGIEVKDEKESDKEAKEVAQYGQDEDDIVGKEENEKEETKPKREMSTSSSLAGDGEKPKHEDFSDASMADAKSSDGVSHHDSEAELKSAEADEQSDGLGGAKADSGDSNGSESSDGSESS